MNSVKCPTCGLISPGTTGSCSGCGLMFESLPPDAYVSLPASELANPQGSYKDSTPRETELGKKIWFWYRVFCAAMAILNLGVALLGMFPLIAGIVIRDKEAMEMVAAGSIYIVLGIILAIPYIIAFFAPRKPWHWVYGMVLIAITLTSCACWPTSIPLLIYWLKPEGKWMFGRE